MRAFLVLLSAALIGCGGGPAPAPTAYLGARGAAAIDVESRALAAPRFVDDDPHEWIDREPWRYDVHGVDVSKWQGAIDWAQVRAAGAGFAFIKATEGGDHLDERFLQNWRGARMAGVPRGAYHFYYFCRTAAEQARWFIANVPRDPSALPPVLDMEWNHQSQTCRLQPPPATVRAEMETFLAIVGRHYGKRPVIYVTPDFYRDNDLGRLQGYHFWLRSVAGHPEAVYPGQPWAFWQYTGTGIVPGIRGRADVNVFAGDRNQWRVWAAGG